MVTSLYESLQLSDVTFASAIGAGGKTSVLMALALDARAVGRPAVLTTTTKIWPMKGVACVVSSRATARASVAGILLRRVTPIMVAGRITDEGKLSGVEADDVSRLRETGTPNVVLIEADGAAGRPLKVHRPWEPVIPVCTELVIVVAGMSSYGLCANRHTVHGVCAATDGARENAVSARFIAEVVIANIQSVPSGMRVAVVLNQCDDVLRYNVALEVQLELCRDHPDVPLFTTTRGRQIVCAPTAISTHP